MRELIDESLDAGGAVIQRNEHRPEQGIVFGNRPETGAFLGRRERDEMSLELPRSVENRQGKAYPSGQRGDECLGQFSGRRLESIANVWPFDRLDTPRIARSDAEHPRAEDAGSIG
ncbi:MAG: hypothetical protein FD129_1289 [bacterium]|nr:MAG: hypothetical protein FD129_1289 [bacterium]